MRGLYAIVDTDALAGRGLDVMPFAEALLAAQPAAIQLRDKSGGARRTLALLRAIQPLAARAGVPLFANDRPDLALLAGCDGVHVGQDDVPVALVRSLGKLRVGVSTHDQRQLEAALAENPDYVAIGPIFPTASKDRPSPVIGMDGLRAMAAAAARARSGTPIVAIGGITLETAAVVGSLVACVAVIGGLLPEGGEGLSRYDEAQRRATAMHAAIKGEIG